MGGENVYIFHMLFKMDFIWCNSAHQMVHGVYLANFVNPIIKSRQFHSPWRCVLLSALGEIGLLYEHGDDVLLAALQLGVELDPRLVGRLVHVEGVDGHEATVPPPDQDEGVLRDYRGWQG